jgi:hypothetical protein
MSPHGNICCDRVQRSAGPQNVQAVHFRPSTPYPRYIFGPGIGVSAPCPMPPRATVTIWTAPQAGRFTIRGPSAIGPWTYRDTSGPYPVFRSGSIGTGQSLGLT